MTEISKTKIARRGSPPNARGSLAPTLTICAGQFSSSSTWAFNVAAEILSRIVSRKKISRSFLDECPHRDILLRTSDYYILKAHIGPKWVFPLCDLLDVPIVLTVREPRDAVASLMARFGDEFDSALQRVASCAESLIGLAGRSNSLLLRYEDRFTSDRATLDKIAAHLGVPLVAADRDAIFARYTPQAVKKTISRLAAKGVFADGSPISTWDEKTHWHPFHVGDGQVGKWRGALTPAQSAQVNYATRAYRAAFGYVSDEPPALPGSTIDFSTKGLGPDYLRDGFSNPEHWGTWTNGPLAEVSLDLAAPITRAVQATMVCILGPSLTLDIPDAGVKMTLNGQDAGAIRAAADNPERLQWIVRLQGPGITGADRVRLRIEQKGIRSPLDLGHSTDGRTLGIGLSRLSLDYE